MSGKTYPFFETEKDDISPLFTNKLQEQAHVGCLRGRFQDGGAAVDWFGGNETLCTPEFDAELKDLLKNLCQDGPLDDSQAMRRFCLEHPQAKMSGRDTFFAFRIDTSRYRYYLRLFPQKQKFFLFCYQTDQFKKDRPTPDYHYQYCKKPRAKQKSGGERA